MNQLPDTNQLATDRTRLAYERTLMTWIRTSASMITFGFTIYKFFQFEAGRDAKVNWGLITPRGFALNLISIGLLSLAVAIIQNRKEQRLLSPERRFSLAELVAGMVSLFGILVLLSAILRS
jgi:putative membrane protein